MSVLIKGMDMPKENDYTIAIVYGDGVVAEYHEDYWIRGADGEKQLGTAVSVPPHGRLIDADALDAGLKEMSEIEWNQKAAPVSWAYAFDTFRDIIERDEPTIIPAEGKEDG